MSARPAGVTEGEATMKSIYPLLAMIGLACLVFALLWTAAVLVVYAVG